MDALRVIALPLVSRVEAVRAAVVGAVAALAALGLLLVVRRATGGITTELGAWRLVATLTLAGAVIFGGRVLWRRVAGTLANRGERMLAWGGSAALVLACLGCAWPSSQSWAWLMWTPLIGADVVSRRGFLRGIAGSIQNDLVAPGIPPDRFAEMPTALRSADFGSAVLDCSRPCEGGGLENVLQRVDRVRDEAGVESIRGTLRAEFAAGQRHATLHVGFCPPLERLPDVEAEVADGPDATVKIVQAFAHGARLEVRLDEPAEEPCSATVEFVAAIPTKSSC